MADEPASPVITNVGPAVTTSGVTTVALGDWRAAIPETLLVEEEGKQVPLRTAKALTSIQDVGGLAKAFHDTKRISGIALDRLEEGLANPKSPLYEMAKKHWGDPPRSLREPGEKATPEERAAYQAELRKRVGVPDKASEYKVKRPDVAIDGAWDAQAEAQFLTAMHGAGAPPSVVQAALDFYGQWERTRMQTATSEATSIEAKLRTEWGPNYDAKVGRANRAISEFGGPDLEDALTNPASPLHAASRHPAMIRAWAAVGDALVESGAMSGEGLQGLSPEEAKAQGDALRAKLQAMPEGHPGRMALVDEIIAVTRAMGGRR